MATKKPAAKKATSKSTAKPTAKKDSRKAELNSVHAAVEAARTNDVTPVVIEGKPHEINSALASPRMQALLKDHQKMGSRPK